MQSLDTVHLRDGHLEVPYADSIICALSELLGSIIHGVELSNLVTVTDFLEKPLDLLTGSQLSEVVLLDAQLRVVRWEQEINCLWLVAIILKKT